MDVARKKGKKNRKHGRITRRGNHATYNAVRRDLRNKKRKLLKHVALQPNDSVASVSLASL